MVVPVQSAGRKRGEWRLVFIILGLVVAVVITTACVGPRLIRGVIQARRDRCAGSLRQLGAALGEYAKAKNHAFPERLADLGGEYVRDPGLFVCPVSGRRYVYVAGLRENDPPHYIIAFDAAGAHGQSGGLNVLHVDGSVKWLDRRQEVRELLERYRAVIAAQGRELKELGEE